jgi:Cu(I)/Ag(I) efflux system membrane fusion protein
VYNASRLWVVLNIYGEQAATVKVGNPVRIVPETAPAKNFRATIDFIEPFYRPESKTLTARVYFNNNNLNIPVGSQVRATVFPAGKEGNWLPREAVLSLGLTKIVFLKEPGGFRAHAARTGMEQNNRIQITDGLSSTDSVAVNAQFLMDNESFIKVSKQ